MNNNKIVGFTFALFAVIIWSITYIFKKNLLLVLTPYEILFYRFLIAYVILLLIYPKFDFSFNLKNESLLFILGFLGVSLYYFLENTSLKYTQASNVGLIVSSIPIFTSIIAHYFQKDEKFHKNLLFGFIFAISGIFIVIFNGKYILKLNPLGDILAFLSTIVFSVYSNLLKKTDNKTNKVIIIRKIFFYGLISISPIIFFSKTKLNLGNILNLNIIIGILFLSIAASILAFFMWHNAIKINGATKTTNFIYLVPLITMVSSYIFLKEKINIVMVSGGVLILAGVYFSYKKKKNERSGIHHHQDEN